jgi:seryl-tRNA synthetase
VIDVKVLRQDPDRVRASQRARGESESLVDDLIKADEARRNAIARFEELRSEQKELGKHVAQAKGEDRAALLSRTKELADMVKKAEAAQNEIAIAFDQMLRQVGNLVFDDVPTGGEDDYVVLETLGVPPRDFAGEGFQPKDHLELGQLLGAIDVERGAKVSGSRFYYLTGQGAELELALISLAMSTAIANGFTPFIPPALVKPNAMEGTGFLGQAAQDVYHLEEDDLYLVGTAEVPLAAYHADEILDADTLPRRYAGFSPSFRREAGSHGKDTRGIFRVHWFDKVEMFVSSRAPEVAAVAEGLRYRARDPVPSARAGCWRSWSERGTQIRLVRLDAQSRSLSRDHLDLQLHGLPSTTAQHPSPLRLRNRTCRHLERHALRHHEDHHHDLGESPAG